MFVILYLETTGNGVQIEEFDRVIKNYLLLNLLLVPWSQVVSENGKSDSKIS